MKILVTGGCGFIGSNLVRQIMLETEHSVLNMDVLTYAGNRESTAEFEDNDRYVFHQTNIADKMAVQKSFNEFDPDAVINLAAESHVDRSIDGPGDFIQTNIVGTFVMLEAARKHFSSLEPTRKDSFRFLHVSTDEVFGTLGATGLFTEKTPYDPRSPYSASKASSDHLVSAWLHTYGLPTLITNCSNNYGPYQYPEKLLPVTIINALHGKEIPIYGEGLNIRDWLYVEDHASGLLRALETGAVGEAYNIGGNNESTNISLVKKICSIMDRLKPRADGKSYSEQITFVKDRPGHDFRYAIDSSKIQRELGWEPSCTVDEGLEKTVTWYLENDTWWKPLLKKGVGLVRLGKKDSQHT